MNKLLTKKEIDDFNSFYIEIMSYSYLYRVEVKEYYVDDIPAFIRSERSFFYENRHNIISEYKTMKGSLKSYKKFLKAIEKGIYGDFYLISYNAHSAILADTNFKLYSVRPLNEPFDKLFTVVKDKNMEYPTVRTTLIPYKDSYMTDGITPIHETNGLIKKMLRGFLKKNSIEPKKSSEIIYIPININIFIHSFEDAHYEKIEKSLMNISEEFTKGLFTFFDKEYIDNVSLVSSFIPMIPFLEDDEDKFFEQLDSIKDSFNRFNIIPTHKFQKIGRKRKSQASKDNTNIFYTLCGVIEIEEDMQDDFDRFIYKINRDKKIREEITIGIENLFLEISKRDNLDVEPIFIGVSAYDLDDDDSLNTFLEFMELTKQDLALMKLYSIHRQKIIIPSFKLLFRSLFKKRVSNS